jgi:hypothetical protein
MRSQRGHARNYKVGNVVRFTRGSRRMEIETGAYAVVERADSDTGRLSVVLNDGRRLDYSPKRLSGVEVFRSEQRKFTAGESHFVRRSEPSGSPTVSSQLSSQLMNARPEFARRAGA